MVTIEANVHFIGTESNRDDTPPPLNPEQEARVLTRVLAKAVRDAEAAVTEIGNIDRSRSESEYLLALYARLSQETGISYQADVERFRARLVELHTGREDALARLDRARALENWLKQQGARAPQRNGWVARLREGSSDRRIAGLPLWGAALLGLILIAGVAYTAARLLSPASQEPSAGAVGSSIASVEYGLIGSHGEVDVILVDAGVNPVALGRRLDRDYADRAKVQVFVFNDRTAAEYLHNNYDIDTSRLTTAQRDAEYAKYYPKWIATYFRDVNNGLNQVEIYQDPRHDVIKTVDLGTPTVVGDGEGAR